MTIYLWLLTPVLMYVFVHFWAKHSPYDAMSAVGTLRRRFRSWVWKRAHERYITTHQKSNRSRASLLRSAKLYADDYTLSTLGEPGEAETHW